MENGYRRTKALISMKRSKIGPGFLYFGAKNQRPRMTLKGHCAPCFKTRTLWCYF